MITIERNEFGTIILPEPDRYYADHSHPCYSIVFMRQVFERIAALEADLARVQAERDALKVDAERYRWLRAPSYDCLARVVFDENLSWKPSGGTLDAAIDAARNKT